MRAAAAGPADPAPSSVLDADAVEQLDIPVVVGDGSSIGATLSMLDLKLADQLGAGTFGTVHAAWCEQTQEEVAVKVVEFDDADLDDDRLCFVKEVAAMKALGDSRYIVGIRRGALDRDAQSGIIVMERADGPDLDEYLQNQDPLSSQEALWIGLRVAKALRDMHAAGLVHRDVKSDNVLLYTCESGDTIAQAKLADLGLVAEKGEPISCVAGTLDFMPNNLVASWHNEDSPAPRPCFSDDMFAFGCVMLEVMDVTEELDRWNKRRRHRIRHNKRVQSFEIPERVRQQYSANLIEAVQACLDEDARLRPSAEDMVQLLSSMVCDNKRPHLSRALTVSATARPSAETTTSSNEAGAGSRTPTEATISTTEIAGGPNLMSEGSSVKTTTSLKLAGDSSEGITASPSDVDDNEAGGIGHRVAKRRRRYEIMNPDPL